MHATPDTKPRRTLRKACPSHRSFWPRVLLVELPRAAACFGLPAAALLVMLHVLGG